MINRKHNILGLLLISLFVFYGTAEASVEKNIVFSAHNSNYWVDGTAWEMGEDVMPHLQQGRIFIPLRYLGYALGLQDQDISWDAKNQTAVLYFPYTTIKLVLNEQEIEANGELLPMDVPPLLVNQRIYLPASFVAAALGYISIWDENSASICINPSQDWHTKVPAEKTPAPPGANGIKTVLDNGMVIAAEPLAASELFFPNAKDNNVYNAGIAAQYVDGKTLKPGQMFSFNQVVGIRAPKRGFIKGQNIEGKPENGGGVCRTSTVLYQVAQKAGLKITEKHPHIPSVWYTPPGTDATVVWGYKDLKFVNNLKHPILIKCGLDEGEKSGARLYAYIYEVIN